MRFIRMITRQEIEASSKEAFWKERASLSSQMRTKIHVGGMNFFRNTGLLWIQEYTLIQDTIRVRIRQPRNLKLAPIFQIPL